MSFKQTIRTTTAKTRVVAGQGEVRRNRLTFQRSRYGICGVQNGTGTGFSPGTSLFFCQYHSTIPRTGPSSTTDKIPT